PAELGSAPQLHTALRVHAAVESNPELGKTRQRSSSSLENPPQRHHFYVVLRQTRAHRLRDLSRVVRISMNTRAVGADGATGAVAQRDGALLRKNKRPLGNPLRRPALLWPFRHVGSVFIIFQIDEALADILQPNPGCSPFRDFSAQNQDQIWVQLLEC